MKRRDLERHLKKHGARLLREGGRHSYWGMDAERSTSIPRHRETVFDGFDEGRVEALLIRGDEAGSLRIAIRVEHGFDQPFVGDFACPSELAALHQAASFGSLAA